jgi:hypothetical protein
VVHDPPNEADQHCGGERQLEIEDADQRTERQAKNNQEKGIIWAKVYEL